MVSKEKGMLLTVAVFVLFGFTACGTATEEVGVIDEDASRIVIALDKDTTVPMIPDDIQKDSDVIETADIAGGYVGVNNAANWMSVSMYTSEEQGDAIGNADIYLADGVLSCSGEIEEIKTNIYKVAVDTGDSVVFGVVDKSDTKHIYLYINGEAIEEFLMTEAYYS